MDRQKMKRLLLLLWIGTSMAAWSQTNPPIWVHDVYRKINYPPEKWHAGFVQARLQAGEDAVGKLKTMERDAINQLAEGIIVTIESETQVENNSGQSGGSDNAVTGIRQKVKTATSATLINLDINSHYDPETGMLYAFAAIKRSDLASYYQKQLLLDVSKAETAIEALRRYIGEGKKSSARGKIKEANRLLDDIRFYRTMLSITNAELNDKELQSGREDGLHRSLEQILSGFESSIVVFMNCQLEKNGARNDAFASDPGILCGIIRQALNENECIMTDDVRQADFELKLITSTTQRSDGNDQFGIISYYANVKGSLYDHTEKRQLADFIIMNDPNVYAAGNSPENAATKAFKLPVLRNMVLEKILPLIIDN